MSFGAVQASLPYASIGNVLAAIIILGVAAYVIINVVFSGKREIGSEIEVAPNRKPYLSDEELEGPKLTRTLNYALWSLAIIAVALPLYWILEPGRQTGAAADFGEKFAKQGEKMFQVTGDNLQALNCAGCHGPKGGGGVKEYNITQPDGTIKVVNWRAPALNTVLLRYSREEVKFILTYGRPFSPMPAWGVVGGGPLNDQQIQNLIDYLETIQLTPEESQQQARDQLAKMMQEKNPDGTPVYASEGEALFNMGVSDGFAGGAYSCARCHTKGWSYAESYAEVKDHSGCGALGPSLCNGGAVAQFPAKTPTGEDSAVQDHIDFVTNGSENGKRYGVQGQGSGKMPGFGLRPAEPALYWINKGLERDASPGMLPLDLIEKIVQYERSL
jgi:mono/diheme cytochrome c family protein